MRETHSAWVVLTVDRAYKLKKPVRFAFLDYASPDARRAACDAEVLVNRALTGDLMLGVRGLRRTDDGIELCRPDARDAIDWVVEMRRFDENRTMAALLERGELTDDLVRAAAARLVAFHDAAEPVEDPDPVGRVTEAILRDVVEVCEIASVEPAEASPGELGAFLLGAVNSCDEEIAARSHAGRVRDGHGDLRAEHVVFEGSDVLIVDRIEFDPRLRRIDVADDLSFLAMDLEARDAPRTAQLLVQAYRDAGGDPGHPPLLALFAAHHALIRAKVVLLRALQEPDADARTEAAQLLRLAARLAWRARAPLAIIVCGPPASGKSTLAAALAQRSGLLVLSSDQVRRDRLRIAADAPAPAEAYAPQARAAVYAEIGSRTRSALDRGDGVIIDATFGEPDLRAAFLNNLTPAQRTRVWSVECRTPPADLVARAAKPRRGGSDAGPVVARQLAQRFRPVTEFAAGQMTTVTGTVPPARQVAAIESWLAG